MARQKRLNLPGAIYHVITRGLNGADLFKENTDKEEFLRWLKLALDKTACQCYSWALMNNHIHLLIRTSETSLSEFVRKALTGYAKYFNRRYQRKGYVYQNRYKSILCQEDAYLLELVRYIHLNPVRAGIVKTFAELDHYPWTGHSAFAGKIEREFQSVGEILLRFGPDKNQAVIGYRKFIQDGWDTGHRQDLMGYGIKRSAIGWGGDSKSNHSQVPWRGDERILGDEKFVQEAIRRAKEIMIKREKYQRAGWSLDQLAKRVCKLMSVSAADLQKKGRKNQISFAKGLLAYWAYRELGINGAEIARFLNIARPAVSKMITLGEQVVKDQKLKLIN